MAADLEARIWGVIGASGTGKGVWTKAQLKALAPPRLVVWDFKNEYDGQAGKRPVATLRDLMARMREAGQDGELLARYVPKGAGEKALRKEFEALCELVYAFEHVTFVAEELANVTTPGWAPAAWRKMTTSGRHAGVHIIGATQTPALVDKSFLGNCTLIHCGPLREHAHRQAVARAMDIDDGRIARLVKFQWLEKNYDTGEVTCGFTYPEGYTGPKHHAANAPTATPGSGTATGAGRSGRGRAGAGTLAASSSPAGRNRRKDAPKTEIRK